jgi:mRNA interferase RelE/StbE
MPDFEVTLARSAHKELSALTNDLVQRIFPRIEGLRFNPRPHGCIKLQGAANLWRLRVGDYRVLYSIDDTHRIVDICAVRHRREVYR